MKKSDKFLAIQSMQDLLSFLKIKKRKLDFLLFVLPVEKKYREFTISKRSGGKRIIKAPNIAIKKLQREVADALLEIYKPKQFVHSYVKDKSIIDSAQVHQAQKWVARIDLSDFFPSIHFGRVYGLFRKHPFNFSSDVATYLGRLCTIDNELPQGAPTSPIISNFICRDLDLKLSKLAVDQRCYYSRYADDLTFSTSRRNFPPAICYIKEDGSNLEAFAGETVTDLIDKAGFKINSQKTSLRDKSSRQMVVGIVANERPNVPKEYIRELRAILYSWKKFGRDKTESFYFMELDKKNRPEDKKLPTIEWVVRGKILYVGRVRGWHDKVFLKLIKKLKEVDPKFKFDPSKYKTNIDSSPIHVWTEGPTDKIHFRTALKSFQKNGLFKGLNLKYESLPNGKSGDDSLLKQCEALSATNQSQPHIFIFDRDNLNILKHIEGDKGGIKVWGNNVFSLALPTPKHRRKDENICVELLYEDSVLKSKYEGKRLYLRAEFKSNGFHISEKFVALNPKKKTLIYDTDVFCLKTQNPVVLKKTDFAKAVSKGISPYEKISFEGFQGLFKEMLNIFQLRD